MAAKFPAGYSIEHPINKPQTESEVFMKVIRPAAKMAMTLLLAISFFADAAGAQTFAEHRLLVQPVPGTSVAQFDQVLAQHGVKTIKTIPQINVHIVSLPAQADEHAMAALLAHDPHVQFAEPDMYVSPQLTANDSYYGSEWQLPKIQAPLAWDSSLGNGVTVAIIDTGVDATHPDLAGKLLSGWDVVSNSSDTSDILGHGTAVAGTVGAVSNNSLGVASVAWNAMLLPVRVSDASNGYAYYSDIATGVIWAADHGARVANISYDVSGSATVQSAAQYMRGKNGNVVVAAGNSGAYSATAPSDAFLSVGATDSNDKIAGFSTYGTFVDLSAPGVGIITLNKGGGYASWSGTSFSSPVVAGVAALVIAANPALSPAQVDNILTSTSDDLGSAGYDMYYGAGRVNAARAVQTALNTPAGDFEAPSVNITSPGTGSTVSGHTTVSVDASDNVGVSKVELFINGSLWATATTAPYDFSWDSSLVANGTATLQADAWDAAGNQAQSQSVDVTVSNITTAPDNQAPTVTFLSPADNSTIGNKVTIRLSASDNVGVTMLSLAIDGSTVSVSNGGSLRYHWSSRKASAGNHTLTATALDAAGNKAGTSITVVK